MKFRTYKTGDEEFDRVFVEALRGLDPNTLSLEEVLLQEKYVNANWDALTKGSGEKDNSANRAE